MQPFVFVRYYLQQGSYRVCAVLLVEDSPGYNDTVTRAYRKLSVPRDVSRQQLMISFSYLDAAKQKGFIEAIKTQPYELRTCGDGSIARPVRVREREGMNLLSLFA